MNSAEVDRRLRRWANAKALPAAYEQKWLTLGERSRTRLLEIAENLKMHTGQFIAALALLEEIALRDGQDVYEILACPSLHRVLNSAGSGPGRARLLLGELRALRYPRLKQASDRLAEGVAAIKLPPGIKIVLPRDLASDEVRVEIVAHGSAEMEQLLACLTAKSNEIIGLAAMLGGADGGLEVE
ncbi:MAG: hypothetical protein JO071_00800 [Deltaproteobacteria bacterium]|nr:hypothetical protein [Deltaproteobacteria bacterium]